MVADPVEGLGSAGAAIVGVVLAVVADPVDGLGSCAAGGAGGGVVDGIMGLLGGCKGCAGCAVGAGCAIDPLCCGVSINVGCIGCAIGGRCAGCVLLLVAESCVSASGWSDTSSVVVPGITGGCASFIMSMYFLKNLGSMVCSDSVI